MNALAHRLDLRLLEQLPDAEVVRRVIRGEPALYELIMRRYNRRLFRIARSILGSDAEAEDAVQDAYVRAWFKLRQFRGPEGFAGWLCRIVTNKALMRRRRLMRVENSHSDDEPPENSLTAPTQADPATQVTALELQHLLEKAIDSLPEVFRTTFVLREVEQMSVTETARCLGIEEATVKTRVHRARRLLQKQLSGEISAALGGIYGFGGERCDRLVARVFAVIRQAG